MAVQHAVTVAIQTADRSSGSGFVFSRAFLSRMGSSLASADILIPPSNPPNILYLSLRTHQKLVQRFPPPAASLFPALITRDTLLIAEGNEGQREDGPHRRLLKKAPE